MCFDLGYKIVKKGKNDGAKRSKGKKENKGLLYAEIERWNKQQELLINQGKYASSTSKSSNTRVWSLYPFSSLFRVYISSYVLIISQSSSVYGVEEYIR